MTTRSTPEGRRIRAGLLALLDARKIGAREVEAMMVDLAAIEGRLAAAAEQAKLASVVLGPAAPPAPTLIAQPMGTTKFARHDHFSHHGKPMPVEPPATTKAREEAGKMGWRHGRWVG